jgi:membrane-anchored mycosin MYCP
LVTVRRLRIRLAVFGILMAALVTWMTVPAAATTVSVKYYVVRSSYQGAPEYLWEISARFLGDGNRYTEIFDLNKGRVQPDGGRLTDPLVIYPKWILILPKDASGSGVQYGPLPGSTPAKTTPPAVPHSTPTRAAAPPPVQRPPVAAAPIAAPPYAAPQNAAPAPSASGSPSAIAAPSAACGQASTPPATGEPWALQRLAPDRVWGRTRGHGVTVAVFGSGVDGTASQLSNRVLPGADIVSGSGAADSDCVGEGTAMAGIIAAAPRDGTGLFGMAPDATIFPVRTTASPAGPTSATLATGIQVATAGGARVIVLPDGYDPTDEAVTAAVNTAVQHNVVVVAAAPTAEHVTDPQHPDGVLWVGATQIDNSLDATYPAGVVDVVAPGTDVVGLGLGDSGPVSVSGTAYAAAYVAGLAALLCSAHPQLTAVEVADRIRTTGDRIGNAGPNGGDYSIINPARALDVIIPIPAAGNVASVAHRGGSGGTAAAGGIALAAVLATIVAVFAIRRRRLGAADPAAEPIPVTGLVTRRAVRI